MPRQNRVTPFGEFEAVSARGTLMGNRGCLHDREGRLGPKRFNHRNWIICLLEFKGRKRTINAPGLYTELFFRDEATALAAGHRPCAECQRDAYNRFKAAWRRGHGLAPDACLSAQEIDAELHTARVDRHRRQITHQARLGDLPDGVFLSLPEAPGHPLVLWGGSLHSWTHEGYHRLQQAHLEATVTVLTPVPLVRTLSAGYLPGCGVSLQQLNVST